MKALSKARYSFICFFLILSWFAVWLAAFHNIYGWLTDDIYQFKRISQYEAGGRNLLDIQWFHAYDWLLVSVPWLLHWGMPSHMVPQAWSQTPHFRALILYTIALHAVVLALIAAFLRQLCKNEAVCVVALALFMTSPTFMFYADLIDSRYLGLVAGLPALRLLLGSSEVVAERLPWPRLVYAYVLPGFLIGVGQSIHYTLLYFVGPVIAVYWIYSLVRFSNRQYTIFKFILFALGICAWFVPVQLLSLAFHPYPSSMLGILSSQVTSLASRYDKVADLASWIHFFLEDMGIPMMVTVLVGFAILAKERWRPSYVDRFHAALILGSTILATLYLIFTPSIAFYRQVCMYQMFYMLAAAIAIERATVALKAIPAARFAVATIAIVAISFVPTLLRMPEVFVAAQGLGRAINFAHGLTGENRVYFIQFYDTDVHPNAVISRHDFEALPNDAVIVTDFPTLFFAKYPDIFALMHDAKPVARFPTEWCTNENWVEERTYWNFRRYQDEPESCNADVYRVVDIRREQHRPAVTVGELSTDSQASRSEGPENIFDRPDPETPIDYTIPCCNAFPFMKNIWESAPSRGPHWAALTLVHPTVLHAITIVPPNYLAPPAFVRAGRAESVRIYGAAPGSSMHLIWSSSNLRDFAIFTATFPAQTISRLRIEIAQPEEHSLDYAIVFQQRLNAAQSSGIEYIRFPGFSIRWAKAR